MPIYEFYCQDCHTVWSFFTAKSGDDRRPACPSCERPDLPRRPSRFATLTHAGDEAATDPLAGLDESRLEGALESMLAEGGSSLDDDDPRTMARLVRRFGELSGLELGDRMEDVVTRLEAGEDPDHLEGELDDAADDDLDELFRVKKALLDRRSRAPRVDEELYFF